MIIKYFSILLFLIVIASFYSCDSQTMISDQNSNSPVPTNVEASAKFQNNIVFLFFTIEKNGDSSELVKLTDKKIADGFVKNALVNDKEYAVGNILVTFIGKDRKEISNRIIEDPLNPEMEIYAEEGMHREKINLPKAEFSIRFNQSGDISEVHLEKINPKSKTNLIIIKL